MGSHFQPNIKTYIAGADLSAKQYHLVKISSSDDEKVELAGANGKAIGVLMNAPGLNQVAEVAVIGGGANLKMDEAAAAGKYLTSSSSSQGEIADAAGEHVCALLMEAAADGDIAEVLVVCFSAYASDV